MTDGTKTLIGSIFALAALVAISGIMADCSKHIADVAASPEKACVEGGGYWFDTAPNAVGHCLKSAK